MKLDERKEAVLEALVTSFIDTAEPVSSGWIAAHSAAHCSSATIRHELEELEACGLLEQPHTSAGRIPTDSGYRYFVDYLMPALKLPEEIEQDIERAFHQEVKSLSDLLSMVSRLLSTFTHQAGIVFLPAILELRFKQVNLVQLEGNRLLVIWISTTGLVKDCVMDASFRPAAADLQTAANFLNRECSGVLFRDLPARVFAELEGKARSLGAAFQIAQKVVQQGVAVLRSHLVSLEGASLILENPEFSSPQKSRLLLRALEQNDMLLPMLTSHPKGVSVQIGSENKADEIRDYSLVSSDYPFGEDAFGVLGVLGPRRMRYSFMVALVQHVSKVMGRVLAQG